MYLYNFPNQKAQSLSVFLKIKVKSVSRDDVQEHKESPMLEDHSSFQMGAEGLSPLGLRGQGLCRGTFSSAQGPGWGGWL